MEIPKSFLIIALFVIVICCGPLTVHGRRSKRMYAMCPPKFIRLGNECYYISREKANWLDAHFECKDRNSRLAEPFKYEDNRLRKHLLRTETDKSSKWIGGIYNWERKIWQWGYNGRAMKYQAFSQMRPGSSEDMKFHCSMMNPTLNYKWSATPCVEQHNFICQHRMPFVSRKNRQRVYARWNETFPNELANEIEVIVESNPHNQTSAVRQRSTSHRGYHINSLDNLNAESGVGSRHQRIHRQERMDHRNQSRRRPSIVDIGRPVVHYAPDPATEIRLDRRRPYDRHHRLRSERIHQQRHQHYRQQTPTTEATTSRLDYRIVTLSPDSNIVDNTPYQPRHISRVPSSTTTTFRTPETTTTTTTTTERTNNMEEQPTYSHHHREHHRHSHHRSKHPEYNEVFEDTTTSTITTTTTTTTTAPPPQVQRKLTEAEKKQRRDNLRKRLSKLSPEKQRQYILMARQKKLQEKIQQNETA